MSMFRATQTTSANVPDTENTITATASGDQSSGYVLTKAISRISVCATNGDSVRLMPAKVGCCVFIANDGAADLQITGAATDTIDGIATATGLVIGETERVILVCVEDGKWTAMVGT